MAKQGIIHDYDLMANQEQSARSQTCVLCGDTPMRFQWSDFHGEAMCCKCGCAYQLKGGSKEEEQEAKYPYLNMREDFLQIAREYFTEAGEFVHYGMTIGEPVGIAALRIWLKKHHPEWLKKGEEG